jgi:tRNA threonylcarbamoyladenosine biosynthesis protein TsaE
MTQPPQDTLTSRSVAETESAAATLLPRLAGGGVVALEGELGAGKTQFVRGLVTALGGDGRLVHSPTYVLLHEYPLAGGRVLFHLDAYRVGADDFESIGFDELLSATREGDAGRRAIVAVEWPAKVAELIPPDAIRVRIEVTSPTQRVIHVR